VSRPTYTTQEAADAAKITRVTLQDWIARRKIKAPRVRLRAGRAVRLWTESDIARLRREREKLYLRDVGRPKKK